MTSNTVQQRPTSPLDTVRHSETPDMSYSVSQRSTTPNTVEQCETPAAATHSYNVRDVSPTSGNTTAPSEVRARTEGDRPMSGKGSGSMLQCPECGNVGMTKEGTDKKSGKQRWKCKACHIKTVNPV